MFSKEYVLECLNKYCHFDGHNLCANNFKELIVSPLKEAGCLGFDWDSGASKGVIIPFDSDFVIKIPFYGEEDCVGYEDGLEDYNEIQARYGDDWSDRVAILEVCPFDGAWSHEGWDYCEAEARIYKEAVNEDLDFLFAKTEKIGEVCGWPVYCQERAVMFHDEGWESPAESIIDRARDLRNMDEAHCYTSSYWIAALLEKYDEDTYWRLCEFCKKYWIGDLHEENIGFLDGSPILVDYSSFDG